MFGKRTTKQIPPVKCKTKIHFTSAAVCRPALELVFDYWPELTKNRMDMRLGRKNAFLLPIIFVISVAEFLFDLSTPLGVSDWVLYFIPLTLTVFVGTRYFPYLLAGLFCILMFAGIYLSPAGGIYHCYALSGRSVSMIGLWVMALLIAERKAMESALRHTERALKAISECNQVLVRASSETALLHEICRIIVDIGGYRLAWVGFRENDENKSVSVAAFAGCDEGYLERMQITWADVERGRGPVGTCIREGQMVVIRNFQTDPRVTPWRAEASKRGFSSCISLPLTDGKTVFAALSIYAKEVDAFTDEEVRLLVELAEDLTYGIQAQRTRLQQQEMEFTLNHERNLLRMLIDNLPDRVFVRDASNRFVIANKALAEAMEVASTDDMLGKTDADFYPAEQAAQFAKDDAEVFAGRALINFEQNSVMPNGEQRIMLVSKLPLKDSKGQVNGLIGIAHDITGRKRDEEKIREQAGMINLAHDAITIRDMDQRITYWNRSAERIYGWSDAEAIGQFSHQLLKLDPNKIAEARRLLLEKGYWIGELTARTKDGRDVLVESSWTLVRNDDGQPKCILAFSVDITEQRRLEQQVTRNQRLESLGTLSSGIAHDLNNILTPIMVSISLLKEQTHEPIMAKLIASLESSTQRGAQLVKQILTFSRGIKGERIPIGLRNIAREIQLLIQETFPKTIQFESSLPDSLWLIIGDPTQIHQVLLNLAINARDAMPNGGKLSINFENTLVDKTAVALNSEIPPGSYVLIQVADTGVGMTPKVIERIFEPFFSTKPTGQGTGLGLSTTLGIVKSHNGFINVYSEPGHGSTFKIYLPARANGELPGPKTAHENLLPRGNGELILLVDDEEAICITVKKILERFGYNIITAANGAEAVALYIARGPEIAAVITDMHMPIMDGPATIASLRSLNPRIKIIVSSGLATNAGFAKAANIGARQFVPKPYSAEKILRTLNDLLGKNEADENSPSI